MSDDLDWTSALGEAVVADAGAVLEAVQGFRRKAQAAGNLKTDDKQTVQVEKEVITIVQSNPEVIYVPQYNPTTVVYAGYAGWGYYPTPYPVYYYPYAPGAAFATGLIWGATIGAAWNGGRYGANYGGNNNININRDTDINIGGGDRGGGSRGDGARRREHLAVEVEQAAGPGQQFRWQDGAFVARGRCPWRRRTGRWRRRTAVGTARWGAGARPSAQPSGGGSAGAGTRPSAQPSGGGAGGASASTAPALRAAAPSAAMTRAARRAWTVHAAPPAAVRRPAAPAGAVAQRRGAQQRRRCALRGGGGGGRRR